MSDDQTQYPSSQFWQAFATPTAQALGARQLKHIDYVLTAQLRRIVGNLEAQLQGEVPPRPMPECGEGAFCPPDLEEVAMAGLGQASQTLGIPNFALEMEELGKLRKVLGRFRLRVIEQREYHAPLLGQNTLLRG